MTTRRHRSRRIALQLLYCCELTGIQSIKELGDIAEYITQEEILTESLASELSEEEVEKRVKEILKDVERRERKNLPPRPRDEEAAELCEFALKLTEGVLFFRETLDRKITSFSEHWRLKRMPCVDRNILRLAAYEILYQPDIPPKVSIDEAVELAKEYGDDKSSAFVNGILDALAASRLKIEQTPEAQKNE